VETGIAAVAVVVGLLLLWTGVKKIRASSYVMAVLTLLDVAVLVAATVILGWLGLALFVVVNIVALVVTSVRLAARKQELLVYAATQFEAPKEDVYALYDRLRDTHRAWRAVDPISRAEFVAAISQRGRSLPEAEAMLVPIVLLWFNDQRRIDIEEITEKFDRLMRLAGEPSDQAMRIADVLTHSARKSAAAFPEMLDAMIAAYEP
jgi:hypothetical protein